MDRRAMMYYLMIVKKLFKNILTKINCIQGSQNYEKKINLIINKQNNKKIINLKKNIFVQYLTINNYILAINACTLEKANIYFLQNNKDPILTKLCIFTSN